MRPGSRGSTGLGAASGLPPGTGFARPGSSSNRLSTGRLRTGVTGSTGTGTEAAQGYALNASVNVSDRPVTGQGMSGMKSQGGGGGRIVQDSAYYVGLLRKKIGDVTKESSKLRTEAEQSSRDSTQYTALERKYENLLRQKETLEGQLADYNLALDKTRSSTDPEDIHQLALNMKEQNRKNGEDLDRIFMARKQRETDTNQIEEQIEGQYKLIEKKIKDLEPGKLKSYNELHNKQRDFQERIHYGEHRVNELSSKIREFEQDNKNTSMRKEFLQLEKNLQSLKRDADALTEELEIANMDPKEANAKFSARVNNFKQGAKSLEEKAGSVRDQIRSSRRTLEELEAGLEDNTAEGESNEAAKYELLVKRDQEMTAFMETFDETRSSILGDQEGVKGTIVSLLEHMSQGLDDTTNMPSTEDHAEMRDAKTFKEKNLETAQRTMESLLAERRKREKELDLLRGSEPKLNEELVNMREKINRMRSDIVAFQDVDTMRKDFERTKAQLVEQKHSYVKRKDSMRQQIQAVSADYESLKKSLNTNEVGKELDDTEKRLKHYERTIFDLKEFVDSKSKETEYESTKFECLRLVNSMNIEIITKLDNM